MGEWIVDASEAASTATNDAMASKNLNTLARGGAVTIGSSGGAKCARPPQLASCPRGGFGTSPRAANVLRRFLSRPPRTWFWCYSSLATNPAHQKKSPGVLALVPGATLVFPIDSRMGPAANGAAAPSSPASVRVSIEHLVSYEHMGIAAVRCNGGCTCDVQRINAHRTDAHRNVSVFLQHSFDLHGASSECKLQIQVLDETSSDGHKFKVRTVTLSAAGSSTSGSGGHSQSLIG